MASPNTRIWDAVSKTDPKHTKPFTRSGGFKGTATKPIWLIKRLTEQFGPCGIGWGMDKPDYQFVTAGDEILVFCTVALWYREAAADAKVATVYGVGGDKVMGKNKYGPFTNDEAAKASYTDAMSNAMKQIGMGADIHMGLFEDDKYLRETAREFAAAEEPHKPSAPGSAGGGTDFRPAGPRQASASGQRMAAEEPQLADNARIKGTLPSKAPAGAPTVAEKRAAKLKDATDKRINALKSVTGWTRPTLDQFWTDNKTWIDWMGDPANEALTEYERFTKAFADAEVNMREVA